MMIERLTIRQLLSTVLQKDIGQRIYTALVSTGRLSKKYCTTRAKSLKVGLK